MIFGLYKLYLLQSSEIWVYGVDSAYTGKRNTFLEHAPCAKNCAKDFTHRRKFRYHPLNERDSAVNRTKLKVRTKDVTSLLSPQADSWLHEKVDKTANKGCSH